MRLWPMTRAPSSRYKPYPIRGEWPMRTGAEYLRSLNDGRRVFVDGESVKDVTAHPAFRQAARSVANLYRHRGRSGAARAHDLRVAEDRRAGVAGLANPAHARRPARPAAVLGNLGGSDLRPDGPVARSRRRLLHRLRGDAAAVRHCGPKVRRQSGRVLRVHARQPHLRQLRHRAAADRPLASRRTSRAIRRSMPASSRSATTAS